MRDKLAAVYGLEPAQVRVIAPDVGGGFGAKIGSYPEELLLGWLARQVGRPVRWAETRSENMVGLGHGRGQLQTIEIGGRRDGTVEAYRLTVAPGRRAPTPRSGRSCPYLTRMMAPGVYDIPKVECNSRGRRHQHHPDRRLPRRRAARGHRRHRAGHGPLRRRDRHGPRRGAPAQPHPGRRLPLHHRHRRHLRRRRLRAAPSTSCSTPPATTSCAPSRPRRRDAGEAVQLGIGVAVYVEITAGPAGRQGVRQGRGRGRRHRPPCYTGSLAPRPGPRHRVRHAGQRRAGHPDGADRGRPRRHRPRRRGRGHHGLAVAAARRLGRARGVGRPWWRRPSSVAADALEANPDDVVLDKAAGPLPRGRHARHRAHLGRAGRAAAADAGDPLSVITDFQATQRRPSPSAPTSPWSRSTPRPARCVLRRLIAVDDAGRILNPLLAEGQRHGGIAQGVAQALLEEVRYDDDGNPLTSNLADYAVISAAELPVFELVRHGDAHRREPARAPRASASRAPSAPPRRCRPRWSTPLAHLGVRHIDMPTTPERVWRAIQAAGTGARMSHAHRGRGPRPPLRRPRGRRRRRPRGGARARSSASSARTAPASPPSCGCSPRCCAPPPGTARVAGHDVVSEAGAVRRSIGVALQDAAIDPLMTGRELVRLQAVLHGISRGRGRPPRRRAARAGGAHGGRRPAGRHLLRRHAAPARPGPVAGPRADRAVPRRAHHRPRPDEPPGAVGGGAPPQRRGHHGVPHHPVPRGGRRAGRAHRHHRRRPHRARGRARGPQGRGRRPHPGGGRARRRSVEAAREVLGRFGDDARRQARRASPSGWPAAPPRCRGALRALDDAGRAPWSTWSSTPPASTTCSPTPPVAASRAPTPTTPTLPRAPRDGRGRASTTTCRIGPPAGARAGARRWPGARSWARSASRRCGSPGCCSRCSSPRSTPRRWAERSSSCPASRRGRLAPRLPAPGVHHPVGALRRSDRRQRHRHRHPDRLLRPPAGLPGVADLDPRRPPRWAPRSPAASRPWSSCSSTAPSGCGSPAAWSGRSCWWSSPWCWPSSSAASPPCWPCAPVRPRRCRTSSRSPSSGCSSRRPSSPPSRWRGSTARSPPATRSPG